MKLFKTGKNKDFNLAYAYLYYLCYLNYGTAKQKPKMQRVQK